MTKEKFAKRLYSFLIQDNIKHYENCPATWSYCATCRDFMDIILPMCPCSYYGPDKAIKIAWEKLSEMDYERK